MALGMTRRPAMHGTQTQQTKMVCWLREIPFPWLSFQQVRLGWHGELHLQCPSQTLACRDASFRAFDAVSAQAGSSIQAATPAAGQQPQIKFEAGRLAILANGSCLAQQGHTQVLCPAIRLSGCMMHRSADAQDCCGSH